MHMDAQATDAEETEDLHDKEKNAEFDDKFKSDVDAMESLFDKEELKSVRQLATLSNHD